MTAKQMKYLLALLNQTEGKQNQSNVAKIFGVNKSTVSRAVTEAVKEGILAEADAPYRLTGYGKDFVKEFTCRLDRISDWLCSQGIEKEKAREDSFHMLETCSEETLVLLKKRGEIIRLHRYMEKAGKNIPVSGERISRYMEAGEYPVSFVFFRSRVQESDAENSKSHRQEISMANQAFYHPGNLLISSKGSYLCLRIRNVLQKSRENQREVEGSLQSMKYASKGKEKTALLNEEKVYLPLEELSFLYIPEERILQGSIMVKMSCTAGEMSMPESEARLVVYL